MTASSDLIFIPEKRRQRQQRQETETAQKIIRFVFHWKPIKMWSISIPESWKAGPWNVHDLSGKFQEKERKIVIDFKEGIFFDFPRALAKKIIQETHSQWAFPHLWKKNSTFFSTKNPLLSPSLQTLSSRETWWERRRVYDRSEMKYKWERVDRCVYLSNKKCFQKNSTPCVIYSSRFSN